LLSYEHTRFKHEFMSEKISRIAIIGAGPAGLTAAYLLGKAKQEVVVFEKDPQYVGGISRTESYKGYYFDICVPAGFSH